MYSDLLYVSNQQHSDLNDSSSWKCIHNKQEEIDKAIAEGNTLTSLYSFSHEPDGEKDDPLRRGNLIFNFICNNSPETAISAGKILVREILCKRFFIDTDCIRYWINGDFGCQIGIPADMYSGEDGNPYLPLIHKFMAFAILNSDKKIKYRIEKYLDMSIYSMWKGNLLAMENTKVSDNKYRVPVTGKDFLSLSPKELLDKCSEPQQPALQNNPQLNKGLRILYQAASCEPNVNGVKNPFETLKNLFSCDFVAHCFEHQNTLSKPEWFTLVSIFKKLFKNYRNLIHCFSCHNKEYKSRSVDFEIANAVQHPVSCDHIHGLGFKCSKECGVKHPEELWRKNMSDKLQKIKKYESRLDGLYFVENEEKKLCSPISVIAKASTANEDEWVKIVEMKSPNGDIKTAIIPMQIFINKDKLIQFLTENGLILESNDEQTKQLLHEYIFFSMIDEKSKIVADRYGWINKDTYVFQDRTFGDPMNKCIYILNEGLLPFKCKGSTLDWWNSIGSLCKNNPVMIFVISYALASALFKVFDINSGGIHFYGGTPELRNALTEVADSIWGSDNVKNLKNILNSEDPIDRMAKTYNDVLLNIKELNSNSIDIILKTLDISDKNTFNPFKEYVAMHDGFNVLNFNFLSTGTLSFSETVSAAGMQAPSPNLISKVINLNLDRYPNQESLVFYGSTKIMEENIELLIKNVHEFYGSVIRKYLDYVLSIRELTYTTLCGVKSDFMCFIGTLNRSYYEVEILEKFALIAACGEIAKSLNILPFDKNVVFDTIKNWFNVWINSINKKEMAKYSSYVDKYYKVM